MEKFDEIKKIINTWDPADLIKDGSPDYEYEPEIRGIEIILKENMDKENLKRFIYHRFIENFGASGNKATDLIQCEQIAQKILNIFK